MKKPVQITMPSPCLVKDELLTPIDGGWHCGGCQKKVYDFTNYTDEQLARIYKNKEGRCGMFLNSQINRPLVLPKRKNIWIAATAAIMSLLTLGNNKTTAQETTPQTIADTIQTQEQKQLISGRVVNFRHPVAGARVKVKGTSREVYTDEDGKYSIEAKTGDVLKVTGKGFKAEKITVGDGINNDVWIVYRNKSRNAPRNPGYF